MAQALDRVGHKGLVCKLKNMILPKQFTQILHSRLVERYFRVKQEEAYSGLKENKFLREVLGSVLFLTYTSYLPVFENNIVATFSDENAILIAMAENTTLKTLQRNSIKQLKILNINETQNWTKKWYIKLTGLKSVHHKFQ